jgi:hypothetical protein
MVTQLPSTGKPGCDTSDMVMIHGLFRLIFGDAPELAAGVAADDAARAQVVGDHLIAIANSLHDHHHGEDILLWDQLEARNPACATHVGQMRAHHAAMAAELDKLEEIVRAWQAEPSTKNRNETVGVLKAVNSLLLEHLGSEEQTILPVASIVFSQAEWNKLGEHGRASVPKNFRFIQLGFIIASMTKPEGRAWMKANLPAPVRLLYRIIGKPQYEKYRAAVYG